MWKWLRTWWLGRRLKHPDSNVRLASAEKLAALGSSSGVDELLMSLPRSATQARAEKALAVAPNNVEAQIAKGNALAGLKNLDAAVAEIEGAIRESPDRSASGAKSSLDMPGSRLCSVRM